MKYELRPDSIEAYRYHSVTGANCVHESASNTMNFIGLRSFLSNFDPFDLFTYTLNSDDKVEINSAKGKSFHISNGEYIVLTCGELRLMSPKDFNKMYRRCPEEI